MDDMFQDFYALENTNGYTAANILSGFWISEKKAFENLVTTKEQDAHEFFQFLAEDLHERNGDGKKPEVGSEHSCNCVIHQTFYGKMQTSTTCQNCSGTTNAVQSFLDLSLGLENLVQKRKKKMGKLSTALTLNECLDEEYVNSDKCEYRCHSCESTQQARRHTSIKRLPNVLSIQLKVRQPTPSSTQTLLTYCAQRFEYKQGRHDRAASKIDEPVHFPLQLNMLPYTNRLRNREGREGMELERSCTYDLLSVVVHVGEIETGHYVSYCRVGDQVCEHNGAFKLADANTRALVVQVQRSQSGDGDYLRGSRRPSLPTVLHHKIFGLKPPQVGVLENVDLVPPLSSSPPHLLPPTSPVNRRHTQE